MDSAVDLMRVFERLRRLLREEDVDSDDILEGVSDNVLRGCVDCSFIESLDFEEGGGIEEDGEA